MSLIDTITARITAHPGEPLVLTDTEIDALGDTDIALLVETYGGSVLLSMPARERAFFDWLAREDAPVWRDLWGDDEDMLVTLAYLKDLRAGARGFLICDLADEPNYYFTPRHIKPDGMVALDAILTKASAGEDLSIAEALMFDILIGPIDLWHFCHARGVPLAAARRAVDELDSHGWLVHLTAREDLVRYIE